MKQVCLNPLGSLKYPWKIGSLLFLLFNLYISSSSSPFPLPLPFLSPSPSLPSISLLQSVYSSSCFPFPLPFPSLPSISLIESVSSSPSSSLLSPSLSASLSPLPFSPPPFILYASFCFVCIAHPVPLITMYVRGEWGVNGGKINK